MNRRAPNICVFFEIFSYLAAIWKFVIYWIGSITMTTITMPTIKHRRPLITYNYYPKSVWFMLMTVAVFLLAIRQQSKKAAHRLFLLLHTWQPKKRKWIFNLYCVNKFLSLATIIATCDHHHHHRCRWRCCCRLSSMQNKVFESQSRHHIGRARRLVCSRRRHLAVGWVEKCLRKFKKESCMPRFGRTVE